MNDADWEVESTIATMMTTTTITAKIVVDGWIKSPGHRQNIVGRYNLTGIGIVRDRAGKLYYTQLFVRTNEHAHQVKRAGAFSLVK